MTVFDDPALDEGRGSPADGDERHDEPCERGGEIAFVLEIERDVDVGGGDRGTKKRAQEDQARHAGAGAKGALGEEFVGAKRDGNNPGRDQQIVPGLALLTREVQGQGGERGQNSPENFGAVDEIGVGDSLCAADAIQHGAEGE